MIDATEALRTAENRFLRDLGWTEVAADTWKAPRDYNGSLSEYRRGHAVKSQRLRLSIHDPRFEVLYEAESAFLRSCGWTREEAVEWRAPKGFLRESGTRCYRWNPETKAHDIELDPQCRDHKKALNMQKARVGI